MDSSLNLIIPDRLHVEELVLSYCIVSFGKIEADMLTDLLIAMLMEEKMHLFSSDVKFLSQLILTLTFMIRPLKYPFPIVYNLPMNKYSMLESPLPALIGLTVP